MKNLWKPLEAVLRAHLAGQSPLPSVPEPARLYWRWFTDLCRTRTSNGYGPNPIGYAEIEAYTRLYGWPLEPRHVDMIMALDRVWMAQARAPENTGGYAPLPKMSDQPLTADAFDAVWG